MSAALDQMLESIRNARQSVRFEAYIFRASPIGEEFKTALIGACSRGLRVQVLLDALGCISLADSFWNEFTAAGGEFKWFNPLDLKRFSFRNHRKVLVCDDAVAYVGGFNIAPEYQGDGVKTGWHDLGVSLSGAFARELAVSFDAMFALADFKHRLFTRLRRSQVKHMTTLTDGRLLVNGPGRRPNHLVGALMADLKQATRVELICGYFLPPRTMWRALANVARDGGSVDLILAGRSDVAVSQLAARHLYQGLLRAGVRIHEYQPQVLHSKLYLMDDAVYLGSANLDRRSLFINYELLVRLHDPTSVRNARRLFQDALGCSKAIDPRLWSKSRSLWAKLKERWAHLILARFDPYVTQWQLRLWEATGSAESLPEPLRSVVRRKTRRQT